MYVYCIILSETLILHICKYFLKALIYLKYAYDVLFIYLCSFSYIYNGFYNMGHPKYIYETI